MLRLNRWLIFAPVAILALFQTASVEAADSQYYSTPQNLTATAFDDGSVALTWEAPSVINHDIAMYLITFYDMDTGVERGGWGIWVYGDKYSATFGHWMFDGSNPVTTGYGAVRFKVNAGSNACIGVADDISCQYGDKASVDVMVLDPSTATTTTTIATTTTTTTTTTVPDTTTTIQETTTSWETTTSSTTTTTTTSTIAPSTTVAVTPNLTTTTLQTIATPPPETTTTAPTTTVPPPETTQPTIPETLPPLPSIETIPPETLNLPPEIVDTLPPPVSTNPTVQTTYTLPFVQPTTIPPPPSSTLPAVPQAPVTLPIPKIVEVPKELVQALLSADNESKPLTEKQFTTAIQAIADLPPTKVVALITQILATAVTPDQAETLAANPEILAVITETQAEEIFTTIEIQELDTTQIAELTISIQQAPPAIKKTFEKTVDIFGGFDDYVPTGSNIPVGERRTLIAVAAGATVTAASSKIRRK